MGYLRFISEVIPYVPLNDLQYKKAKLGDTPFKVNDSLGLYMLVNFKGSKLWRRKYQYRAKKKLVTHGAYPGVIEAACCFRHSSISASM